MPHTDDEQKLLTPRDLLTGELPGVLSLWKCAATPNTAHALLAFWAGLQRIATGEPDSDEGKLNALVKNSASDLTRLACERSLFEAKDWLDQAEQLRIAWEKGEEDPLEIDWQAHQLFKRLDHAALAVWTVEKLAGSDVDGSRLIAAKEALNKADDFLAEHVNLFLSLATDVAAVLSIMPSELEEQEPGLWETLLRHRRIEEARDELEALPDRADILASFRRFPGLEVTRELQAMETRFRRRRAGVDASGVGNAVPHLDSQPHLMSERQ